MLLFLEDRIRGGFGDAHLETPEIVEREVL